METSYPLHPVGRVLETLRKPPNLAPSIAKGSGRCSVHHILGRDPPPPSQLFTAGSGCSAYEHFPDDLGGTHQGPVRPYPPSGR